jgi:Tripartite tricarboxylate transporter TctA family/Tripartite tricarboxylate transporter TctB family
VIGAMICFLAANQLAKLVLIRAGILVPCVLAISFVGAYQGSRSFGDLVVLLVFGAVGWVMKRFGWARAPLILGFILGKLIEKYLFISTQRYDFAWLERPGVMAILVIAALILLRPLFAMALRSWRSAAAEPDLDATPPLAPSPAGSTATAIVSPVDRIAAPALWVVVGLGLVFAFWSATDWRLAARLMPQTAAAGGLLVIVLGAAGALLGKAPNFAFSRARSETASALAGVSDRVVYGRLAVQFLWLLSLLAGVFVIGMLPALGLFMVLYMIVEGRTRSRTAILIAAPLLIGMYLLFVRLLHVPWPPSLIGDAVPWLRAIPGRLM